MSQAKLTFDSSIQDAEILLAHFDSANTHPPPENTEVLKRAGLVMALTAWETYVEDLAQELVRGRLANSNDEHLTALVRGRLESELRRFHNPNSEKTRQLFIDYLAIDVTRQWRWGGYEPESAMAKLNELISKRGDAVHRSKALQPDAPAPHLVKREDLDKAIRFLKHLVAATERAVAECLALTTTSSPTAYPSATL
jgi:hypothetical protein